MVGGVRHFEFIWSCRSRHKARKHGWDHGWRSGLALASHLCDPGSINQSIIYLNTLRQRVKKKSFKIRTCNTLRFSYSPSRGLSLFFVLTLLRGFFSGFRGSSSSSSWWVLSRTKAHLHRARSLPLAAH